MNVITVMPAPDRVRGDGSGIQSTKLPLSAAHFQLDSRFRGNDDGIEAHFGSII
jgi:hypothetical protein